MKQLTCEMCGSTDLMKQDGVFVCQSCGMKYSVEDAKKMMVEGTVDVQGTVKVDNTGMIDNYLNLATRAIDSNNNKEAESYANKIIELDPQNAMAWTIKGAAAGWQTTGGNNRFNETVDCWKNAVNCIKDDETLPVLGYIYDTGNNIANAIVAMHCDNFVSYRSEDNASDLINNVTYITGNIADFTASVNFADYSFSLIQKIADLTEEGNDEEEIEKLTEQVKETNEIIAKFTGWQEEIYQSFSQKINSAAVSGSSAADTDFGPEYKSNESAYFRWIEEIELCISLENVAMIYAQQADTVEAIYKNIYFLHMNLMLSCDSFIRSYVHRWRSTPDDIIINKISTMTVIHKHAVKEDEEKKNKKISDIKKKHEDEKKERINQYWEDHSDEKIALEQEKEKLLDEISIIRKECEEAVSNIKNEIETVKSTYSAKISEFSDLISNLTAEKNSLGIFKTKEKKALQEKINKIENETKDAELKCNSQIGEINSKVKSVTTPFDDKITKLDKRIEEIDCELTKDR